MRRNARRILVTVLCCLLSVMLLTAGQALADTGRIINRQPFKPATQTPQPTETPAPADPAAKAQFSRKLPTRNTPATAAPATDAVPTAAPTSVPDVDKPRLPDLGPYLKAQALLLEEDRLIGNISYDIYYYEYYKTGMSTVSNLNAYTWTLSGSDIIFTDLTNYDNDLGAMTAFDHLFSFSIDGKTAYASVYASFFGGACSMHLFIPDSIDYNPTYTPGDHNMIFYNADLYDTDTIYTLSDSPITCISCHGTKKCADCRGTKTCRNPYTGETYDCSCGDGVCPICNGEGVW